VVKLFAAGRGDDDGTADIDPVIADTGVRLEGEYHAGWITASRWRAAFGPTKVTLRLAWSDIDLGAAGEKVRAKRMHHRGVAPAFGRAVRLLHRGQKIGEGERLEAGVVRLNATLSHFLLVSSIGSSATVICTWIS